MLLRVISIFILFIIAGCVQGPGVSVGPVTGVNVSTQPTDVTVKVDETKFMEVKAPTAQKMVMQPVQWKVLNKTDVLALIKQLDNKPDSTFSIFVLDSSGFRALDLNIQEMRRYIFEQQAIITFYQKLQAGMAENANNAQDVKK